ncbi:hypothetical protein B0T17DRAFT_655809 [Bombardia bombarda]|uniref:Uncharacterized protein n=1 Tax=Bombardia bombarda TaxID=252184 RepID=A0AA39WUI8_9PEZI|nr:hypothetical protein B0T17DRAFT_655809 [Bombardia bombarda]
MSRLVRFRANRRPKRERTMPNQNIDEQVPGWPSQKKSASKWLETMGLFSAAKCLALMPDDAFATPQFDVAHILGTTMDTDSTEFKAIGAVLRNMDHTISLGLKTYQAPKALDRQDAPQHQIDFDAVKIIDNMNPSSIQIKAFMTLVEWLDKGVLQLATSQKYQQKQEQQPVIADANKPSRQLRESQAASKIPTRPIRHNRHPRIPSRHTHSLGTFPPLSFSGNDTDPAKNQYQFIEWRSKIELYWERNANQYPDERTKMLHIASLLRGPALAVIDSSIPFYNEPGAVGFKAMNTAEAMMAALHKAFFTVDIAHDAETRDAKTSDSETDNKETNDIATDDEETFDDAVARMRDLYQRGDKFKYYGPFITEFNILADKLGLSPSLKVFLLREKIGAALTEAVSHQDFTPALDDFARWNALLSALACEYDIFSPPAAGAGAH